MTRKKKNKWSFSSFTPVGSNWKGPGGVKSAKKTSKRKKRRKRRRK